MTVDYRNGVSILLLIFYLPALAIAILLTIRHGFSKSSGWRFMIIFTLARVLCACLELATINQPTNVSLYIGYVVLIGIAVSPLELVAFGYVGSSVTNCCLTLKDRKTCDRRSEPRFAALDISSCHEQQNFTFQAKKC